jgi:hypothetical protein
LKWQGATVFGVDLVGNQNDGIIIIPYRMGQTAAVFNLLRSVESRGLVFPSSLRPSRMTVSRGFRDLSNPLAWTTELIREIFPESQDMTMMPTGIATFSGEARIGVLKFQNNPGFAARHFFGADLFRNNLLFRNIVIAWFCMSRLFGKSEDFADRCIFP